MQPLGYQTPDAAARTLSPRLVVLPALGVAATMAAFMNHLNEPFPVLTVKDALLQVGSSLVVIGLWAWWALAARRARLPSSTLALMSIVAVLHVAFTLIFTRVYFDQPWNP